MKLTGGFLAQSELHKTLTALKVIQKKSSLTPKLDGSLVEERKAFIFELQYPGGTGASLWSPALMLFLFFFFLATNGALCKYILT